MTTNDARLVQPPPKGRARCRACRTPFLRPDNPNARAWVCQPCVEGYVESCHGLAWKHAGKWYRQAGHVLGELSDCGQIALQALVEAAKRFDPDRGIRFVTFADYYVRGRLQCAARRGAAANGCHGELWRSGVAWDDLERQGGIWAERVRQAKGAMQPMSLQRSFTGGEDDGKTLGDITPAPMPREPMCDVEAVRRSLAKLEERDQVVLTLRYGLDGGDVRPLWRIAEMLGLSRERVRQVQRRAEGRLRREMRG